MGNRDSSCTSLLTNCCYSSQPKRYSERAHNKPVNSEIKTEGPITSKDLQRDTHLKDASELDLCGISIHHLRTTFMAQVYAAGLDERARIYDLENLRKFNEFGIIRQAGASVKCPMDGRMGAAYVHTLSGEDNVGAATFMISYAWGYTIGDIIDTLERHCELNSLNVKRSYVWICCLCVNQHRVVEMKQQGKVVTFDDLATTFRSRVTGIGHIVAMMAPWFAPTYLERLWCVYEMYMAHLHGCKVTIGMPSSERDNFLHGFIASGSAENTLIDKLLKTLNDTSVEEAKASVEADRFSILKLIHDGPGYEGFDLIINELLRQWAMTLVDEEVKYRKMTLENDAIYNQMSYIKEEEDGNDSAVVHILDIILFFQRVGLLFEKMGLIDRARDLYEDTKNMIEVKFGTGHVVMTDPLLNLGNICKRQGQHDEAMVHFQQMLSIFEREYGVDNLNTATALESIALVYDDQGLYDEAIEIYRKVEIIKTRDLGRTAIPTVETMENIALTLMKQGNDEDAIKIFMNVLEIKVEHYGGGSIHEALTLRNIAVTLQKLFRHEEAMKKCHESLAIYEKVYGPEHPDTIAVSNMVGLLIVLHQEMGKDMN